MRVTLEFNLPEEQEELYSAQNGAEYRAILNDVMQEVRGKLKHGDLPVAEHKAWSDISELFHEALTETNLEYP